MTVGGAITTIIRHLASNVVLITLLLEWKSVRRSFVGSLGGHGRRRPLSSHHWTEALAPDGGDGAEDAFAVNEGIKY